jgi:hypothetical protein
VKDSSHPALLQGWNCTNSKENSTTFILIHILWAQNSLQLLPVQLLKVVVVRRENY